MTDWAMGKLWEMGSQNRNNSLQNNGLCYSSSSLLFGTNPLFPLILRGRKSNKTLKHNKLQVFSKRLHFENGGFCYGRTMGKAILGSFRQEWPFFYSNQDQRKVKQMKTEAIHPSLFIQEELDARGWSLADLANKMGHKDQAINKLALDLYFEVGPIRANCRIGEHMAQQMAKAFGVSKELLINLENRWLENIK